MANKWVYMFEEGDMTMRNLLGGKGANLAEMTKIGLPVPQGFTVTTEACTQYYEDGRKINDEIMTQVMEGVKKMEEINGKKFGDLQNPLLVSVRSGARASMPGMMDTILNLGLNDQVVETMIAGNDDPAFERFVYDSYRRFIQMFSDVVMEVGKKYFEQLIDKMKTEKGVQYDVGKDVNFGCGTVTCNYDGKNKSRCTIGDGAFIGCNTNLIAPVEVGKKAYIAAGSTITDDIPGDSLAVARARQVIKENWVNIKKPYKEKK
jgi:hypothetical protein